MSTERGKERREKKKKSRALFLGREEGLANSSPAVGAMHFVAADG
jgi:hypothetical protein